MRVRIGGQRIYLLWTANGSRPLCLGYRDQIVCQQDIQVVSDRNGSHIQAFRKCPHGSLPFLFQDFQNAAANVLQSSTPIFK